MSGDGWIYVGLLGAVGTLILCMTAASLHGEHQQTVRYTVCVQHHSPGECKCP